MPETIDDRIGLAIWTAADEVRVVSTGDLVAAVQVRIVGVRRARIIRRAAMGGVGVAVVSAAVLAAALHHGPVAHRVVVGSAPTSAAMPVTTRPSSTKAPAYPPQPPVSAVPGYSPTQAATLLAQCSAVSGASRPGAVLRAAATDAAGATLVITTTSGWQTCNVPVHGVPEQSGSQVFQTWAATDGWAKPSAAGPTAPDPPATAEAPTPAPDYYLTSAVEVLSSGGGVVGPPVGGWRNDIIGRTSADIARVSAVMPNGATVFASVQNGMFIIDQLTPSESIYGPGSSTAVLGYNAAGQLVYQPPPSTAASSIPCYTTPDGQAVTPQIGGRTCKTAVPWES